MLIPDSVLGQEEFSRRRQSSDRFLFTRDPAKFRHRHPAIFRQIFLVQSHFWQRHIDKVNIVLEGDGTIIDATFGRGGISETSKACKKTKKGQPTPSADGWERRPRGPGWDYKGASSLWGRRLVYVSTWREEEKTLEQSTLIGGTCCTFHSYCLKELVMYTILQYMRVWGTLGLSTIVDQAAEKT